MVERVFQHSVSKVARGTGAQLALDHHRPVQRRGVGSRQHRGQDRPVPFRPGTPHPAAPHRPYPGNPGRRPDPGISVAFLIKPGAPRLGPPLGRPIGHRRLAHVPSPLLPGGLQGGPYLPDLPHLRGLHGRCS